MLSSESEPCTHPERPDGRHETYLRSDGTTFCRACGAEFGRLKRPELKLKKGRPDVHR